MKNILRIIKVIKNLAIVGFIAAYILPVEENVPFGFLAAIASLAEAVSNLSFAMFMGFLPNLTVSFLILKAHKIKQWNIIVLLLLSIITYWGALVWINNPPAVSLNFWNANLDQSRQVLKIGYWVWNFSILVFLVFSMLENLVFSRYVKRKTISSAKAKGQ